MFRIYHTDSLTAVSKKKVFSARQNAFLEHHQYLLKQITGIFPIVFDNSSSPQNEDNVSISVTIPDWPPQYSTVCRG
jgi:hypothetical protein